MSVDFREFQGMTFMVNSNELYHSGIKGMKWGIRRYQNKDGSLTSAGKIRYGSSTTKGRDKLRFNKASFNSNKIRKKNIKSINFLEKAKKYLQKSSIMNKKISENDVDSKKRKIVRRVLSKVELIRINLQTIEQMNRDQQNQLFNQQQQIFNQQNQLFNQQQQMMTMPPPMMMF